MELKLQPSQPENDRLVSLADVKALHALMNAKPDSSIQLLEGKKIISLADLVELRTTINRKLSNYTYLSEVICSIILTFEKGQVKEYSNWPEFEQESFNILNSKTTSLSLSWDFFIKLPNYHNPQRHTLKVRVGQSISPKEMMELVFSSDNVNELNEKRADGVVKVDFVDQVIAAELLNLASNWFEGLKKTTVSSGLQVVFEKHQNLFIAIIRNFTPISILAIYHYYFYSFCNWAANPSSVSITNIETLLLTFLFIFFIGSLIGSKFAMWTDKKIDSYKRPSQFEITKGDQNAVHDNSIANTAITKDITTKMILAVVTAIVSFGTKLILEHFIK